MSPRSKTTSRYRTPRKRRSRKQNRVSQKVQHHHFLLRMELETCPAKEDKDHVRDMIASIIKDIGMKSLAAPHVYYMTYPRWNEGLTGIAPIETSHIAFHFWTRPDPKILHTSKSNCLLEFDIYTCGTLTSRQVGRVLHHLTQYRPTYADATILNRNTGLTIERHFHWSCESQGRSSEQSWASWLESDRFT